MNGNSYSITTSSIPMLGPGVSPTSPRARATPHGGNKWRKKKKELVDIKKKNIIIISIRLYIKGK